MESKGENSNVVFGHEAGWKDVMSKMSERKARPRSPRVSLGGLKGEDEVLKEVDLQ